MKTSTRLLPIAALMLSLALLIYLLVLGLAQSAGADGIVHYVKPEGAGDCGMWATACDLQTALSQATYGDQIWVAEGVYTPTSSGVLTATFRLGYDVELYGGFAGTENSLEQRDWETYVTVLSGDIDDNDIKDPNGVITDTANIMGDNSYHVVTANGLIYTTILDGFTVTGGNADVFPDGYLGGGLINNSSHPILTNIIFSGNNALGGGGIYNDNSHPTLINVAFSGNSADAGGGLLNTFLSGPTLTNVTFSNNSATNEGGAVANYEDSFPRFTNVTLSGNIANLGGGMFNKNSRPTLTDVIFDNNVGHAVGGGMFNIEGSNPELTNVTFVGNQSTEGGGLHNNNSSPELTNIIFNGNSADLGGGIMNSESSHSLTNVTFSGNNATDGGGMYNEISNPVLVNVTFSGNNATNGGGMYNFAGSSPSLDNTIFWNNEATSGPQILNDGNSSAPAIDYSLIEGGCPEHGTCPNLKIANPEFVHDPNPGDGDWTTTDDNDYGDLRLQLTSPAVDAGNNTAVPIAVTFDLDGNSRFVDIEDVVDTGNGTPPIVDMGAYEARLKIIFLPTILNNE